MPSTLPVPSFVRRRAFAALLLAFAASPTLAAGGYELLQGLMSPQRSERRETAEKLIAMGDASLAPGIVDAIFFTAKENRREMIGVLEALTGESPGEGYYDWIELIGRRDDIEPKEGYLRWKAALYKLIDEDYLKVFYPGAPSRIRPEEIVSGGVRFDGLPTLENPPRISAAEARYLKDDELVFGVDIGGEQVAYPRRVLSWHEMLNDVVGGTPITLSYCTLCGSAVVYATATPSGRARRFGTSGLLYRSNKLMFDHATLSLWSNLTGEPVFGRLARSPLQLEMLPVTLTTWSDWRQLHPKTSTFALDKETARQWGFDYKPGAADRARRNVAFPVWQKSDALERNDQVYALRHAEVAKAYPLEALLDAGLVHDNVGGDDLVLLADRDSSAVRVYLAGGHTFRRGDDRWSLIDEVDGTWQVEEAHLAAEDGRKLARIPGHVAFWFGWYGFYPDTEVYRGDG